jgi:uncharacterized membrane protein YkvA (DUF1232 family)
LRRSLRERARELRAEVGALVIAARRDDVPWIARFVVLAVVAYAISPVDLIPDFIPVIGLLDDIVLIPLGIMLARRLIPDEVLAECREEAARRALERPSTWRGALLIAATWLVVVLVAWVTVRALR